MHANYEVKRKLWRKMYIKKSISAAWLSKNWTSSKNIKTKKIYRAYSTENSATSYQQIKLLPYLLSSSSSSEYEMNLHINPPPQFLLFHFQENTYKECVYLCAAGELLNLNAHCRTVLFPLDEMVIHLMGQSCPCCSLQV
jgi:hypothetical protein